ncbi:MAG: myo-inositol-1(or 4)-monophosphatase [Gammaproteobacteria bacterium]|jgi:myo-inositol-1(or 4)-monophosphatase
MDTENPILSRQLFAENIASEAGAFAESYFRHPQDLTIESKNPRDFVSEADRLVEKMIREQIVVTYPDDDIVGEEGGGVETDAYWSLDPIDGTSNFLAGIPLWGVSIAYCENNVPIVGAIAIPMLDILVSASAAAKGIRFNREVRTERVSSAIPTFSIGQSPYWDTQSFRQVENIFRDAGLECMNYRCTVVSVAFAALGFTHGYYEENTNMWDVAAGTIIAKQAGLNANIIIKEGNSPLTISILTEEMHDKISYKLAQKRMTEV